MSKSNDLFFASVLRDYSQSTLCIVRLFKIEFVKAGKPEMSLKSHIMS